MVYDIAANRTILFGGLETSGLPSGDTWSYDYGTNAWSILAVNSPGNLFIPSMAYDSTQDRVLLFGGTELVGSMFVWKNDTWALSLAKKTWTNTHPSTSPPPRGGASATYNSVSEVGLVFGGTNTFANTSSGYFNDTWAYNATANAWSNVTPLESPSPRILSVLAYDPIADRTVLFGGAPGSGIPYADAWAFQYSRPPPSFPPSEPRNLTAVGGNSQVVLTWEAPALNGSAPVTNYRIYRGTTPGGESRLTTLGNVFTYTDSAVANGVTYYYEATAISSAGEGPKSNETFATPTTVPFAPRSLIAAAGDGQVILRWEAPASNGGSAITNYSVYRGTSSGAETLVIKLGPVLTHIDSGLANGQPYYYEVTANNSVGEGPKSSEASATPAAVPSEPQGLTATAAEGQVTLSWTAPASNGGSAITGYKLYRGTSSGTETFLTSVGLSLVYTDGGLTNGQTYYYKVSAVNSAGESPQSSEASATPVAPATTPSAPRNLVATPGHAQITLTWQAPASIGGSAITGYRVYRGTVSGSETLVASLGPVLMYSDSGLTNGQIYYYEVGSVNGVGEGPRSSEVYATPTPLPDTIPPAIVITSPANNSVLASNAATVMGTASDNVAVQKVEISTDGTRWTLASGLTSWSASVSLLEGANTIYVRATYGSGNQATLRITVTVQAVQPSGLPLSPPLIAGLVIVFVAIAAAAGAFLTKRKRRRVPPPT